MTASNIPKIEEGILSFWEKYDCFQESLRRSSGKPEYTFYDGPPFATGLPHYGHLVASTLKDIVPRFWTMRGFHVDRRFGWDVHGLPIEYEIEKKLGIKTKQEILDFGIAQYNEECRKIVLQYREEWRTTINRLGRWVDFDRDYKTMDSTYMESVWWVFKQLFDKGLVYRGTKIMPYSSACATPLSNFEAKSNYRTVSDPSLVVKFPICGDDCSFLVWTTTPWTLLSNLALCVHPKLEYVKIDAKGAKYILGKDAVARYFPEYKVLEEYCGTDLVGKRYQPLFSFFNGFSSNAFQVVCDEYVSATTGTGVVHQAPAFGEDDHRVCLKNGIITKSRAPPCPLDANCRFTAEVASDSLDITELNIKDADKPIIIHLKKRGLVFSSTRKEHENPFCWRSDTPLIYRSVDCWFVNVEVIKDRLIANNKKTHWVPEGIRDGRFGNWLEDARDWCVSRNRFWGTPIPIWVSEDLQEIRCVGSISELEQLCGLEKGSIHDLHRHHIDKLVIPSDRKGHPPLQRVEEVLDCWFESGAMPYAYRHYPFNDEKLLLLGDFIAEGLDQTRGWFYTLMVLSTALFDKPAFKNVIVNGLVLAADGEKMSKRKQNYPAPEEIINKYGSDALRLYLISTGIVHAEALRFTETDLKNILKTVHIYVYNALEFYTQMTGLYEKIGEIKFVPFDVLKDKPNIENILDNWILQCLNDLIVNVNREMEKYELRHIVQRFIKFIGKLSKWYLNLNKTRLKAFHKSDLKEAQLSLSVLHNCLYYFSIVLAPFAPFLAEHLFQKLNGRYMNNVGGCESELRSRCGPMVRNGTSPHDSVHYQPMVRNIWDGSELLLPMEKLEIVFNLARFLRTEKLRIPLKMPVKSMTIVSPHEKMLSRFENYFYEELNVLEVKYESDETGYVEYCMVPNMRLIGRTFKKDTREIVKLLENMKSNRVKELAELESFNLDRFTVNREMFSVKRIAKQELTVEEDILVLMDGEVTQEIRNKYETKLLNRKIQDLRKEIGLIPIDFIHIYYTITKDDTTNGDLRRILDGNKLTPLPDNPKVFCEREFAVYGGEAKLRIYFERAV